MYLFTKLKVLAITLLLITTVAFAQNKSIAVNLGDVNDEFLQAGGWDTTQTAWSLECWVKFTALPSSGNEAHIMEFWSGGAGEGGQLYLKDSGYLTTAGNNYATGLTGETEIQLDTWYHLVYVLDGPNNQNIIYLNGEEEMSGAADGNVIGKPQPVQDSLVIAHFRGNAYSGHWSEVEGYIDEVRVWYKALSVEEIGARMDSAITSAEGLEAVYNFQDPNNLGKDATGNGHDAWAVNIDVSNSSDDAPDLQFPTAIGDQHDGLAPKEFRLSQNYPNPFNPSTKIDFTIEKPSSVRLEVYNVVGEKVTELVNSKMNAGTYSVTFDAANLPNGVYFYKLFAGKFTSVKKMLLIK